MDVSKWDRNFLIDQAIPDGLAWYDGLAAPIAVHGLAVTGPEGCRRLPQAVLQETGNSGYDKFGVCTSGGRLRFRTDADIVAIRVELTDAVLMPDMPLSGSSGCDVYVGDRDPRFVSFLFPRQGDQLVYAACFSPDSTETVTVNLPLYNGVRSVAIGLPPQASLWAPAPYRVEAPIVFYGSSITQGACAGRPGNDYPAILSRWLGADYINLGFSGSAQGEPAMARYLAGLTMSACVLEYDYNAPNAAHLQKTYGPFFDILRAAQPDLPIIGMSRVNFRHFPEESRQRRAAIRQVYDRAQAAGDRRAWFIDGDTIFDEREWDSCMTGKCHPNDLGFMRMAQALFPLLQRELTGVEGL